MGINWKELSVLELVQADVLDKPMDGNHGEIHPKGSDFVSTGIPFIMASNLLNGQVDTVGCKFITKEQASRLRKGFSKTGDVLLSHKATIGRTAIVGETDDDYIMLTPQVTCYRIKDRTRLNYRYLKYYFDSEPFQQLLNQWAGGGSTRAYLGITGQQKLPIVVPPLPEQKRIAHILGSLDNKIELNRQMNATLEGMAQSLFKSWFVDFDPVIDNALVAGNPIPEVFAARAETRRKALADGTANREVARQFPDAFQATDEMGWIPEGWKISSIVEQTNLTMGQSPSSNYYNKDGDGLPFHQGVMNYGERFPKHEQYSTEGTRYAEQGDILFSVRAPVGRINISDCRIIIGRGLSALRHKKNYQGFLVYFLKHAFQKEDSIGSGTIFNAVNKKDMESISYIAPVDNLSKRFNNIANSLDEKIADNASQATNLTNLRETLLPKLISGEIRIPEAEKITEEALA